MIKKHNSLVRSEAIINSFISSMHQNDNLDGVVEVFKNEDKQGYVMKLYKTFEPDSDLCVWVYEDLTHKVINTIIGNHNNCDELNNWIGEDLKYNQYPVITNIKRDIVASFVDYIYDHYNKNIKI